MKTYYFEAYVGKPEKATIAVGHIVGAVSQLNAYNILRRKFGRRFGSLISLFQVAKPEKLRASRQYLIMAQKSIPRGAIVEMR